ncbi:dehydrogenase/reductase SDR family member 1 [Lingula anatina]|uniref:Dehydrogenase/reductase SDR family member 1 n=1 Tax=Lingula anatina TaxID=7574 RepID=A0A1S3H760_LINAN|nr:dehydrogenase/reductase SDR family member 1 [Lingula anatina]|eukprot:XP_013381817.1 dehydrogenase/reductase SDR family member 1 [Lingula anatina]
MANPLAGKVAIVTGATRGIGKGIALQLAKAGAVVYITGRTLKPRSDLPGCSLEEVAREISENSGQCIPIQCDHSKDEDIKALFDRVKEEQKGKLDIMVNNAYSAVNAIGEVMGKPFWEQPTTMWDTVNNVGLRNHYICSVYASQIMVPRKEGLIVNISSAGGLSYLFNVAYGIGKEACDRMAADCAIELRKHKVAFVSLWPGAVQTEHITKMMASEKGNDLKLPGIKPEVVKKIFENGETPQFAGMCIAKLALDPNIMQKTGKVLMTSDLANEYDLTDVNGRKPLGMRSVKTLLNYNGNTWLAAVVPRFLKVPLWMVALRGKKL